MSARPTLTRGLLAVLSFLAAVGPFATDMYLASFTSIANDLGASPSSVQLTLTAFLVGMGSGQLLLGPLSDRYGRRPVLIAALTVFAAASIAMVFSPTIGIFVALRFVQGFAGSAGMVISRAIAVDLAKGDAAIRAISLIMMFVGLGPLLAPPVGGLILTVGDWRAVLAVLAAIATAMLLLAVCFIPESLPPADRATAGPATVLRRFAGLLANPRFLLLICVFGFAFGGMMSYISASPFVGQVILGMAPLTYSFAFGAGTLAMVLANLLNARLAGSGRVRPQRMLAIGAALSLAAGATLTAAWLTDMLSPALFIAFAFTLTGGTGLIMSNASALALRLADEARGAASALLGAAQFAVGGLASPLVGAWGEHTALPMALFVLGVGVLCVTGALLLRRFAR